MDQQTAQQGSLTYASTLNKLTNLEELVKYITAQNAIHAHNNEKLIKILANMQEQVVKVRGQIDTIKSKGSTATAAIKQMIENAGTKQQAVLGNIKTMIGNLTKIDKLEGAVSGLEKDIQLLSNKALEGATGLNASASEFKPTAGEDNSNATEDAGNQQRGGYTYGRSRMIRSMSRRRTKKSKGKSKSSFKYL